MTTFKPRITSIKGLSDKRRLPRLGKIRLGIKKKSMRTGAEFPEEVPYFVVPEEIKKVYGDKPTELDVMLPIDDIESVFPVSYKYYGSGKGLKCTGDGEIAYYADEKTKEIIEKKCPCENLDNSKCKQSGTLNVILHKINVGGVYQITTSSFNSIIDVASGLDYVRALVGRFAMVPLKLRRIATETHHNDKKQIHYTMQIILDASIDAINQLRSDTMRVLEHTTKIALPEPLNENPEFDPPDIIIDEDVQPETSEKQSCIEQPQEEIKLISEAQIKRMFAIARTHGWKNDELKQYLIDQYAVATSKEIPVSIYDDILKYIEDNSKVLA